MPRILGIDLAHGLTGLVALPAEWMATGSPDWSDVQWEALQLGHSSVMHPVDRREFIITAIFRAADEFGADVLAVEESFTARNSASTKLAKLHGELERRCHHERVELVKVTRPATYKLAIGKGNASKGVLQMMLRSIGAPFASSADCCDAWAVANAALADRGFRCVGVAA